MTARDSQRSKLYAAESLLEALPLASDARSSFATAVLVSRQVRSVYGDVQLTTVNKTSGWCGCEWQSAAVGRTKIMTPCKGWGIPYKFLHGLAHLLEPSNEEVAYHSPQFARTYLGLVKRHLGDEAHEILKGAYREKHVKTRTVSPEAREAARERYMARKEENLETELRALSDRLKAGRA